MSMNTYIVRDYGLLVTPEIAAWIALAVQKKDGTVTSHLQELVNNGQFAKMAKENFAELCGSFDLDIDLSDWLDLTKDYLEELSIGNNYTSNFTGTADYMLFPEDKIKEDSGFNEHYDEDTLLYIPLQKGPSVFASQVYGNGDEILQELREKLKGILPDDFDYRSNLAEIDGTIYC